MPATLAERVIWPIVVLFACVLPESAASRGMAREKSPNIFIAFVDDWGRHASAYAKLDGPGLANDLIRTPNFDRLAREGVLFRQAFVSAPSCTPCRSALLSGQHFWRTGRGAILRGAVWDPKIPSFPLLLHEAGYQIGQTYKVWSPGTPNDAPFGGDRFAYEQRGSRFNKFSKNVTDLVASGVSVADAKQRLFDEGVANFADFLADRKPDQPFCYWFGPTNVHRQWQRGSGKRLWGIEPDDLKGKLPKFLPDVPEIREDLADYFGEIQAFDAMLGQLLARLEATGELENTIVIVSGDHGAPGFTHGKCNLYDFGVRVPLVIRWGGARGGRVVDDLISLTDLAPTLLEAAGVGRPETMTGRSLVNVLKSSATGQVDPQRKTIFTGRERHVDSARDDHLPYPQRAIRTPEYLYIVNFEPDRWPLGNPYRLDDAQPPTAENVARDTRITFKDMDAGPTKGWLVAQRHEPQWQSYYRLAFGKRPRAELYLVNEDPDQIHNVADNPKYKAIRSDLEKQLMDELKRTGDPRVTGDGSYFENPPLSGPAVE
jgi:N-sulfoglucosamine sulfohydrolase